MKPRVLFVLKYRDNPWGPYDDDPSACGTVKKGLSSGLLNSATFIRDMLEVNGIEAKLVQVQDNNYIDREVTQFKPTHVIIEALWVVSDKFEILTRLHPDVRWIVRNHSTVPFFSMEGNAVQRLLDYLKYPNVSIGNNDPRCQADMEFLAVRAGYDDIDRKVLLLPNFYPVSGRPPRRKKREDGFVDVGCFGAIRPLKNTLIQAVAALKYAEDTDQELRFHINGSRLEGRGEPVLQNIRSLFERMPGAELVEHGWMDHGDFLEVCARMDIALQVSYAETFNIVLADMVSKGVAVVGSSEIPWLWSEVAADPNSSEDIAAKMKRAMFFRDLLGTMWDPSRYNLKKYSDESADTWLTYLAWSLNDR